MLFATFPDVIDEQFEFHSEGKSGLRREASESNGIVVCGVNGTLALPNCCPKALHAK